MTRRRFHPKAAAVAIMVPLAVGAPTAAAHAADLVETAEQRGGFDTLIRALRAAGVADTLAAEGPFTLFAPTDEAFAQLPEGLLEDLLAGDPDRLERLLGHHVVAGRAYPSNDLPIQLEPLAGGPIVVDFEAGALTLRNVTDQDQAAVPDAEDLDRRRARVVIGDVEADNGILHAIDTVLVPPDLARAPAAAEDEPPAVAEPEVAVAAAPPEPEEVPQDGAPEVEPAEAPTGPGEVVAPVGVPVEPEAVTQAERLAEEAATAATARRAEPATGEADVGDEPAEPEADREPVEPTVTVEQVEPDVAVEPAEPEVIVERGEPDVTVVRPGTEAEAPEADVTGGAAEPAEAPAAEEAAAEPETLAAVVGEEPAAGAGAEAAPEPEPEPGAAAAPVTPPTRVDVASFEELVGRKVRSAQGEETGEVADVIFVKATGEIELVIVDFGGFLGLFTKPVAVPWREVEFDDPNGDLIVGLDAEAIEDAPEFDYDELNEALYRAHVGRRSPTG